MRRPAGAALVLFCTEQIPHIYRGLFGKQWKKGTYVRTSCFRTRAAEVRKGWAAWLACWAHRGAQHCARATSAATWPLQSNLA